MSDEIQESVSILSRAQSICDEVVAEANAKAKSIVEEAEKEAQLKAQNIDQEIADKIAELNKLRELESEYRGRMAEELNGYLAIVNANN